jgi:CRP/FNR family cyclic AMP-dependent transcriptional regulator
MSAFFDYPTADGSPAPAEGTDDVFLANATDQDWATLVRYTTRRHFETGDVVLDAGGTDSSLYLIVDGTLDVLVPQSGLFGGKQRLISTVGAGSVLGEMSFFDGGGRSAVVQATSPVNVAELSRSGFDALAAAEPRLSNQILLDLGRILASRLRESQRASLGTY